MTWEKQSKDSLKTTWSTLTMPDKCVIFLLIDRKEKDTRLCSSNKSNLLIKRIITGIRLVRKMKLQHRIWLWEKKPRRNDNLMRQRMVVQMPLKNLRSIIREKLLKLGMLMMILHSLRITSTKLSRLRDRINRMLSSHLFRNRWLILGYKPTVNRYPLPALAQINIWRLKIYRNYKNKIPFKWEIIVKTAIHLLWSNKEIQTMIEIITKDFNRPVVWISPSRKYLRLLSIKTIRKGCKLKWVPKVSRDQLQSRLNFNKWIIKEIKVMLLIQIHLKMPMEWLILRISLI